MRHRTVTGSAFREIRLKRKLTVPQLAALANVSASYIKYIEAGRCQPSDPYAQVLAEALSCSVNKFSVLKASAKPARRAA